MQLVVFAVALSDVAENHREPLCRVSSSTHPSSPRLQALPLNRHRRAYTSSSCSNRNNHSFLHVTSSSSSMMVVVLMSFMASNGCYDLNTFGFDVHHRHSDPVVEILGTDGVPHIGIPQECGSQGSDFPPPAMILFRLVGTTLDAVEEIIEERDLPLSSDRGNIMDVAENLSTAKKNEIQHLMHMVQLGEEQNQMTRTLLQILTEGRQVLSGASEAVEKFRSMHLNYGTKAVMGSMIYN